MPETANQVQLTVNQFIPDLQIYLKGCRWHWQYIDICSEYDGNGFDDAFQALLNFTSFLVEFSNALTD